jgi:hypothetical protein
MGTIGVAPLFKGSRFKGSMFGLEELYDRCQGDSTDAPSVRGTFCVVETFQLTMELSLLRFVYGHA